MVEGDYTAHTLIEMIDRRVGLPLRGAPLWGSRGERAWRRFLFCGDEKLGCMVEEEHEMKIWAANLAVILA